MVLTLFFKYVGTGVCARVAVIRKAGTQATYRFSRFGGKHFAGDCCEASRIILSNVPL